MRSGGHCMFACMTGPEMQFTINAPDTNFLALKPTRYVAFDCFHIGIWRMDFMSH